MPTNKILTSELNSLADSLDGRLHFDDLLRTIYATDASVYQVMPLAVAFPKNEEDLKKLIRFAQKNKTSLIPRTAGTSLAGQCVGEGIVVDVSKHFTKILEFNAEERWVRVQPGVVRDELNAFLKPHGLFFSPITSTANRAMIGGMVGNNSSGTNSIIYGSTREHVIELKTILSDGSDAVFSEIDESVFQQKLKLQNLEGDIYRDIFEELKKEDLAEKIRTEFPKASIHRRNTGYAVDYLLNQKPFAQNPNDQKLTASKKRNLSEADASQYEDGNTENETLNLRTSVLGYARTTGAGASNNFNFCKLLTGSEGTLAFTTEIKLNLDPLPEPHEIIVAAHFETIRDCMLATQFAMKFTPSACELMDKTILDCTKGNIEQSKNRDFVVGDPKGVLLVEFRGKTREEAEAKADELIEGFKNQTQENAVPKNRSSSGVENGSAENEISANSSVLGFDRTTVGGAANPMGYAFPKIYPPKTKGVWSLRSAGLGLLANIPGDKKAVACIEDTAVALEDLADYIDDFKEMMKGFEQESVYYAHAGAGEIHLRPILNLKKSKDVEDFYKISEASAKLVKKYKGSLSGEHGDGRVRAAFIPLMVGEEVYDFFKRIKNSWDPNHIFNPGKIVDAPPMNEALRYERDQETPEFETVFDFSETGGILRAAEKCNGSGDCRKLPLSGGTMCPSYQATRNETDTTRARANTLRNFLTKSAMSPEDLPPPPLSEGVPMGKGGTLGAFRRWQLLLKRGRTGFTNRKNQTKATSSPFRGIGGNPFNHPEIKEVMDLCLSCKGCTSECPSNVDMSSLKAEFLHQYYKSNGVPLRAWAFANISRLNALGAWFPSITNFILGNKLTGGLLKKILDVAPERSLPGLHKTTLRNWFLKNHNLLKVNSLSKPRNPNRSSSEAENGSMENQSSKLRASVLGSARTTTREAAKNSAVYIFCDEFTNFNDTEIGIKTVELLNALGYEVRMPKHPESGRAAMSKGLLLRAKKLANENVRIFKDLISEETPLIGIEPSAILSFRDEYPRLVEKDLRQAAKKMSKHVMTIEEFLAKEMEVGNIISDQFEEAPKQILLHGHCHQKALSSVDPTAWILSLPKNYNLEIIPSGCCGMAGSFGYEKEHFEVSMKIGEMVLFPKVRAAGEEVIVAAPGTSCRHQIADGTGRKALHPVEVLWEAVKEK